MKKFTLLLMSLFLSIFIFGQQVARNYVVVEIGTYVTCGYCPGAAMGADDLVENGHQVAIIENHQGDAFSNTGSHSRNSFYGITGYPTAFFDGNDNVVGGSHTSSLYQTYLPKYNNAIAVMSDFTTDLSYTHTGSDYDVTIDITEPGNYSGTNLVVHLFLTESHISYSWQGLDELNFVNRAMYPDQNGTAYTGGSQTINLSFTADAGWDLSNCELVAFIQDKDTKHILQSDKATLAEPTGTNNITVEEVNEIPDVCEGTITPSLKIKNLGSSDITSLAIDYSINSGATTGTYNWSGDPIGFNSYATITLNDINFSLLANNTIDFDISQVNGTTDDDVSNNTGTANFDKAPEGTMHVFLTLHTDGWGSECTWNIKNSSGTVLESGGPYGNNQTINEDFFIAPDCNIFNLFDEYGDGGGSVTLEDSEGQVFYYTSGSYGSGESQKFTTFAIAPTVSFSPANGATNVNPIGYIIITFDQPVRKIDDSEITDGDISSFVTLTDPSKGNINYTGTINAEKTVITLIPDNLLPESTNITVTITDNSIENEYDVALANASATFTTSAYPAANVTFNPADGATDVNPAADITLTFDNAMRKVDDSEITDGDISSFVTLTDPSKGDIAYTGTINAGKTIITLHPDEALPLSTNITVSVAGNNIENEYDIALAESSATFTIAATGISEIFNNYKISPNPAYDFVNISGLNSGKIILTDISGKQILSQNIASEKEQINIGNLSPGIYILKIITDIGIFTDKIIKN